MDYARLVREQETKLLLGLIGREAEGTYGSVPMLAKAVCRVAQKYLVHSATAWSMPGWGITGSLVNTIE